jgi:hypothetical protein
MTAKIRYLRRPSGPSLRGRPRVARDAENVRSLPSVGSGSGTGVVPCAVSQTAAAGIRLPRRATAVRRPARHCAAHRDAACHRRRPQPGHRPPCSAGDRRSRRAPSRRAEAQLVRADLLAADGHTAEAVTVLDEALRAAEPDGLRRPFRDATRAAHSPRPRRRPPGEAVWLPTSADFMQPARRPVGTTLMCDAAGQLPGHPALKPQSDPAAWTVTVAWYV